MPTVRQSFFAPIFLFVALAYALSWGVWLFGFFLNPELTTLQDELFAPFLFLGSFGPTLAALLTVAWQDGRSAVFTLVRRLIRLKVDWRVYLFTFFALPAVGFLLYLLLGIPASIPLWQIAITILPLAPLNAFFGGILFGYGPLGEEMGWRGVLQARL